MTLESALQELSAAHGPKALTTAFNRLRGQVSASRRQASRRLGALAETFIEAMRIWDAQKADGVSKADRVTGLAKSLEAAWPKGRDTTWKYLCDHCHDYGLEILTCPGDATCGRSKPHQAHEWGNPCWCSKGQRFKVPAKPSAENFSAAGKTPKRSAFARIGR